MPLNFVSFIKERVKEQKPSTVNEKSQLDGTAVSHTEMVVIL